MAIYNINKNGNLEVTHNLINYRAPLIEYPTEDINEIEKDIKRIASKLSNNPLYLTPFRVEIVNSSVVYFYDVKNLNTFLSLRSFSFEDKLKYFKSLIEIAKNKDVHTIWNKYNFVVDPYEQNVKAIIYETDYIKLHEETNILEGLKELILISLTTLDSIVGKPRRASFIDQEDDIIQFAETVLLQINDIHDLDDFVNTKIIEHEYSQLTKKERKEYIKNNEVEDVKSLKSIIAKGNKIKAPKLNVKKAKVKKTPKPKEKYYGKKKNDKKMYVGLGVLVVLALGVNMLLSNPEAQTETDLEIENTEGNSELSIDLSNLDDSEINISEIGETEFDQELLFSYRLSQIGSNDQAIKVLESIGYNNLPTPDQKIMLDIYTKIGSYEKAITLNPMMAESIVNNLIAENKTESIIQIQDNLEESNPYVDFEVAHLRGEAQKLVELKDNIKLNGRKEEQITLAYIQLGEIDLAEKFAESVGNPDLMQMVQSRK